MIFGAGTYVFFDEITRRAIRIKAFDVPVEISVPVGQGFYTMSPGEKAPNGDTERLIGGRWVSTPPAPSTFHRYDWAREEWVFDQARALAALADYRWQKESGGTTWRDWPVHTDRDSRAAALAELINLQTGVRNEQEAWKFADGEFRVLSNDDFIDMYAAAVAFVRRCFACEALCQTRIASGEYDIETMWAQEWGKL